MPPEFPGTRPRISGSFPDGYPETIVWDDFPAWGYFIRHAENVVFTNVTHEVSPEDAREAIVLEDVTGFKTVGPGNPWFSRPNNKCHEARQHNSD